MFVCACFLGRMEFLLSAQRRKSRTCGGRLTLSTELLSGGRAAHVGTHSGRYVSFAAFQRNCYGRARLWIAWGIARAPLISICCRSCWADDRNGAPPWHPGVSGVRCGFHGFFASMDCSQRASAWGPQPVVLALRRRSRLCHVLPCLEPVPCRCVASPGTAAGHTGYTN